MGDSAAARAARAATMHMSVFAGARKMVAPAGNN
jgi:hypothetical protein